MAYFFFPSKDDSKGIRGKALFLQVDLSYQIIFTAYYILKWFLTYQGSKSETSIGSLWKAQTKKALKDYFIENISLLTVLKQYSSNFHSVIQGWATSLVGRPDLLKKVLGGPD